MIDVWQYFVYAFGSEYARVLNMLRLHMILNKIRHNRYEYASVTHGSIEENVYNVSGVCKCYICKGFWIKHFIIYMPWFITKRYIMDAWQGSEYFSGSEFTRILNMAGFRKILKKRCTIDAWQDSEYSSGSEYGKILKMSGLHKVLNKTLRYIDIWYGPEYASSS